MSSPPTRSAWAQALQIFRWDVRYQLRDPRTLLFMFLSPILLCPALIWSNQFMAERQEGKLTVAAPATFAEWTTAEDELDVVGGTLEEPESTDGEQVRAEVILPARDGDPYRIRYQGARIESVAALERTRAVIQRHDEAQRADRFARLGLPPPEAIMSAQPVDVADAAARTGNLLGRIIPVGLLLLIMSGGLHTSLDLITGERERGTLETLLSSPVDRTAVLFAKGLSVLVTSATTGLLALLSLGVSAWAFDLGLDGGFALAPARIALAAVLLLPLIVTLTAALMMLAARAPDYKAGQFLSAPAMFAALLPAGVAALPDVESTALLALLPITGVSIAVREVLSGVADGPMIALALAAAIGHAIGATWLAARALVGERFLLGPPDRRARYARGDFAPEAFGIFIIAVLGMWFFGQTAQGLDLVGGMFFTQIAVLMLPAIAAVAWLGRPLESTLRLRRPRAKDLVLAIIGGAAATGIGQLVFIIQSPVITVSESFLTDFGNMFVDISLPVALITFALLPGICEEILFRGAILGLLRPRFSVLACCLIVGALFGLIHLAVPRILPTGVLGILLTWAALRSGSVWVPIIMHALHNGILFTIALTADESTSQTDMLPWWALALLSTVAVGAVAAMGGRDERGSPATG